jgi:hypothetical protein
MTLVPYSNLKPNNLGALLFIARCLAYLGYVFFGLALAIFLAVSLSYFSPGEPTLVRGSLVYSGQPALFKSVMVGFFGIGASILTLIISSLCAALVSWESTFSSPKHESV